MDQITFNEFINWLIFGGGSVMASSFILERLPKFQELTSGGRELVSYISASALGIGAYVLITYAPDFVSAAQPYFIILAGTFVSIFLNNVFHNTDKKSIENHVEASVEAGNKEVK